MISNQVNRANYDAKKYRCAPWFGDRGPNWSRFFKPDFENMLHKETDAFNSLHQFLITEDDYGGMNGPNHPAGAGLAALNVQSTAARATRAQKTYGLILTHIENEDIKDAIQNHVANTLPVVNAAAAAAALAAGNPPPAPVLPINWCSLLWAWIDVTYGQPQRTGLLHLNMNNTWASIKITDVGINRNTIRALHSHLLRCNRERTIPLPVIDVWTKFLSIIKFPISQRS